MQDKIYIKNKKGLKLCAVIHKPTTIKVKLPGIIIVHGFTGYKEERSLEALCEDIEKSNYVAIRFDASGSGESEGTFENDYRFSNYVEDMESVYEYFRSQEFVDESKIAVVGHSMGGMQVIAFGSSHPEIKAICSISAPYLLGRAGSLNRFFSEWEEKGYLEKESSVLGKIKIPFEFVIDSEKWNMVDYVKLIKQPILFILGKKDVNVAPELTRVIYESANQPKQLIEFDDMDHYYKNFPDIISKVNREVLSFFEMQFR